MRFSKAVSIVLYVNFIASVLAQVSPESSGSSDKSPWIITGIVSALLLLAVVALVISWRDKLTSCMTNNNCSHSVRRLSRRFRPSRNLRTDTEADASDNNNYDEVNFKTDRCPPPSGKSKHTAAVTAQDQSAKKQTEPVDEDPVQSVFSDVNNESSQPNTHQTHDSVRDRPLSRDSEVDNVYIMPDVPQTHDRVLDRALSRESNGSNVYILPDVPQDHGSVPDKPLSRDSEADNVYIMPDVSQNHEYVEDNPQQQDDIPDRPLSRDSVYEQPRSLTIILDDREELPPDEDQIPQYEDTQSSYDGEEPQCEYMNSSTL